MNWFERDFFIELYLMESLRQTDFTINKLVLMINMCRCCVDDF